MQCDEVSPVYYLLQDQSILIPALLRFCSAYCFICRVVVVVVV